MALHQDVPHIVRRYHTQHADPIQEAVSLPHLLQLHPHRPVAANDNVDIGVSRQHLAEVGGRVSSMVVVGWVMRSSFSRVGTGLEAAP